jgi:hypothetical protein
MAIRYELVDAEPLDIFQGVCQRCRRPKRETDTGYPLSTWADKHNASCVQCGGQVKMERVYGVQIGMQCDERCENATGSHCECFCGGINHGNVWSQEDEVMASALAQFRESQERRDEKRNQREEARRKEQLVAYREWRHQAPQKELVDYLLEYYRRVKAGTEQYENRFLDSLIEWLQQHKPLTENQLEAGLRTMHRREAAARKEPAHEHLNHEGVTTGVFKYQGEIYVVKPNKTGTHSYANRIVDCPPRVNKYGVTIKTEFKYAPGILGRLTEDMRLNEEDFQKFIVQYGRCLCGRSLKRDRSVRIMMGPRCAKKYGVKW